MLAGLIFVALVECGAWLVVAAFLWSFRDFLAASHPDVVVQRTNWALIVLAGAVINSIALLTFVVRRRSWGWPILAGVQVADLLFSFTAIVVADPTWWLFGALATIVLILLFLVRGFPAERVPASTR